MIQSLKTVPLVLIIILLHFSCKNKSKNDIAVKPLKKNNHVDTLEFFKIEPTSKYSKTGFSLRIVDDISKGYPLNEWVKWKFIWAPEHNRLAANSELIASCPDTNVSIKYENDSIFYVKVNDQYKGLSPFRSNKPKNPNLFSLQFSISPNEGYAIHSYYKNALTRADDTLRSVVLTREFNWIKIK